MSYEKQRTVEEGEEIVKSGDREGRSPTSGPAVMGEVESTNKASTVRLNDNSEVVISNLEMLELLEDIKGELKLIRTHMSLLTETNISVEEVE